MFFNCHTILHVETVTLIHEELDPCMVVSISFQEESLSLISIVENGNVSSMVDIAYWRSYTHRPLPLSSHRPVSSVSQTQPNFWGADLFFLELVKCMMNVDECSLVTIKFLRKGHLSKSLWPMVTE